MDSKPFYQSMTFWGAACLAISGVFSAFGFVPSVATATGVAGVPLVGYGLRRALD